MKVFAVITVARQVDGEYIFIKTEKAFKSAQKADECLKKIKSNNVYWEQEPLAFFAKKKQLYAFKHNGFWKSLDTLKDKNDFNNLYKKNKNPWKV